MTLEQIILKRDIVKTSFQRIQIPASSLMRGFPIGQGECRAVILCAIKKVLNSVTNADVPTNQFLIYYGDASEQLIELQAGEHSEIIFCKDLSEVYVRGIGIANEVNIIVYYGEEYGESD